jgi:2,3-bisphosphoglycerate-dependent phosphoglycerate mutase
MTHRVFLIRHCQSEANREERAETRGDSALTPLGVEQARRRATALAEHQLAAVTVVASPLQRAAFTAKAIADHHGWEVSHDDRLLEGDLGRLEGLSYAEILALVPEGAGWVNADDHGGESLDTVGERMLEAVAAALGASNGPVIAVSHGFAISALLHRLGHAGILLANGDMLEVHLDTTMTIQLVHHHPLADGATE